MLPILDIGTVDSHRKYPQAYTILSRVRRLIRMDMVMKTKKTKIDDTAMLYDMKPIGIALNV